MTKKNIKGLRAWRLISKIRIEQIKTMNKIRDNTDRAIVIKLIKRHDDLQKRREICDKFLYETY
jgi:hypothetical protein